MTSLFDVNTLVAIADAGHVYHRRIHRWLTAHPDDTWASCPQTESGFIRVLTHPLYRGGPVSPAEAIATLRNMKAVASRGHIFWSEPVSLTDPALIDPAKAPADRRIADVYLAALAFRHHARLVTFDDDIPWQAVIGASAELIEIPPA